MKTPDKPRGYQRPGAVIDDATYTLPELKARLGWSEQAFRTARRQGLRVHRAGRQGFVTGRDFREFLESIEAKRQRNLPADREGEK